MSETEDRILTWEIVFQNQTEHINDHQDTTKRRPQYLVDTSCQACNTRKEGIRTTVEFQNFWNYIANTFEAVEYTDITKYHFTQFGELAV